ncbi:MAG: response regulator [Nodosilinea sp.]
MKILLVEDDLTTRELLALHLTAARYTVEEAADGNTALELATLWAYDLIVLDIQIPQLDGLSLCRQLRARGITPPILMLTAQAEDADVITGLDAGADDYVTKPFEVSRVLARIRALLRRGAIAQAIPSLVWGELCLDPAVAQVTYGTQIIPLTPKEYNLLELFLRHPKRIFSRSTILDHLWTIDDSPTEGAVTNLVKDLRNRLRRSGVVENVIQTVYGLGYRLGELPASPGSLPQAARGQPVPNPAPQPQNTGGIEAIAARFQASVQQRLGVIEDAIRVLQAGELSRQQRDMACDEAHRLVGGLGTFGYEEGSVLARQIEVMLASAASLNGSATAQLSRWLLALKQSLTPPEPQGNRPLPPCLTSTHRLITVAVDPDLRHQLQQVASSRGWQVETVAGMAELLQAMAQGAADAVVLSLDSTLPLAEKLLPLRDLKYGYPQLPVLVLTDQDSLEERVQVVRLRGDRYLVAPVTATQVLDALAPLLPLAPAPEAQVMVVDHDPVIRATIADLLTPWGLRVIELGHPSQFWEMLRQTQPDLLLLALDMPTFSGIDLCQVVRQDAEFGNVPILMIATHSDTATVRMVFEAGGDDLIGQPIVGPELVTRVLSRIERSRLRHQVEQMHQHQAVFWVQQESIDPLTQVANGLHFDAFLQQQWERHRQDQAPISLVLARPDDFKTYHQVHGATAADVVLRRMARTLHQTINPNIDLVARYGDEDFAIVLPNTNLDGALRVVSRLQQAVAQLKITHPTAAAGGYLSLSLGIAGTVPTATLVSDHLLKTAHQALKIAQARGGNTFCLYPM